MLPRRWHDYGGQRRSQKAWHLRRDEVQERLQGHLQPGFSWPWPPACSAWPGPTPQFLVGAVFQQNDPQLPKRITPILIANLSRRLPSCGQEFPPPSSMIAILPCLSLQNCKELPLRTLYEKCLNKDRRKCWACRRNQPPHRQHLAQPSPAGRRHHHPGRIHRRDARGAVFHSRALRDLPLRREHRTHL